VDFNTLTDNQLWEAVEKSEGNKKGLILVELGLRSLVNGEFRKAISCAGPAIQIFSELGVTDQKAIAQYVLGSASREDGETGIAIDTLKLACNGLRQSGNEKLLGMACSELAQAYSDYGDWINANDTYVSSFTILSSVGDSLGVTQVGSSFGEMLGSLGLQSKALDVFEKTKIFAKELEDPLKVAYLDDRIAACLIELARGNEALDHLKSALDVISYTGTKDQYAWALYRYGWTLQTFNYDHQALSVLEDAKGIFNELGEVQKKAKCDFQIAHALSSLGDHGEANGLYLTLEGVFRSLGDDETAILCVVNRAINIAKFGIKEEAVQIYKSMLADDICNKYDYIVRHIKIELARCFNFMQFYGEALEQVDSINIESYGDNLLGRLEYLNVKARTLVHNKRIEEAEEVLKKIMNIEFSRGFENTYAEALETLSIISHIKENETEMLDLRGRSISYYLAGNDLINARRLADSFTFAPSKTIEKVQKLVQENPGFSFGFVP